jgi:hypothetical protein
MLAALKEIVELVGPASYIPPRTREIARAAIAKAEGRE